MERVSMRVLVLSYVFSPCPQSASQRVTSFVSAFCAKGFKITVLAANRCFKKKWNTTLNNNLLIYDFRYPKWLLSVSTVMINPILFLLYFLMALIRVLREDIDAILASVPNGEVVVAGFLISKLFRTPLVIDMRDLYPPNPHLISYIPLPIPQRLNQCSIKLLSFLYRRVSKITCADSDIKERLSEYGVSASNVVVIPNGADASVYKPCKSIEEREKTRSQYGLPLKDLIFVYAGALVGYYPVWAAVGGLKHVPDKERSNIRLLIISFKDYSRYVKLTRSLGLENYVKFMGPLSIPETAKVLSACDVGIVAYPREKIWAGMYGAKIFSYMSCGLPILASGPQMGVIKNLISQSKLGVYLGEPDELNFARGFLYFLDNEDKKIIMGKNARQTVEKTYDRKKLALKMLDVIYTTVKM